MIATALNLFIVAVLLCLAGWIGSMIVDRLPVGEPIKNVFRIVGLLILLVIVVVIAISFLPGHQPLWRSSTIEQTQPKLFRTLTGERSNDHVFVTS